MKKLLCLIFLFSSLIAVNALAAQTDTTININGKNVNFTEESGYPFIDENNKMMVPVRVAMNAADAGVVWNGTTQTVEIHKNKTTVFIPINESYIKVNGNTVQNDAAAKIINGKTYLPIRIVLESIGFKVEWDSNSRTVFASDFIEITEWVPYSTSDMGLLLENIAKGNVVYSNGQYWASPEYSTMMANEEIVYYNDIASNNDSYNKPSSDNKDESKLFYYAWYDKNHLAIENISLDISDFSVRLEVDSGYATVQLKQYANGTLRLVEKDTGSVIFECFFDRYLLEQSSDYKAEVEINGLTMKIPLVDNGSFEFLGKDLYDMGIIKGFTSN